MGNPKSIEPFFTPKSVAVIGASEKPGSIGHTIFDNMKKSAVGKLFPVNPKYESIQGLKAYPSISAIGERPEMAVIAVPAKGVAAALEECMKLRVKAAIIISAGFSETGEKEETQKIAELARKHPRTRVIGPNCVGVLNNHNKVDTTFFERSRMKEPKKGTLSFISQSGALGSMILDWIATQEFGINKFVSYGNAMDVDEADLLEYFGKDEGTKVIAMYLEGAKDGRKFFETAKKISRKKPIIVLKGGRNEETSKATASHTGSLAGSSKVYDAAFRQAGIIQADDLLDLFSIAKLLEREPLPRGNRVQIITNGGGFGIVTADQVIANGLELAKITPETAAKLKAEMPTITTGNPIDLIGDADFERYLKAIKACHKDENVDILMVLVLFNLPNLEVEKLAGLTKPQGKITKPMMVVAIGSDFTQKYLEKVEREGFTTFNYPSIAAKALKEAVGYAEYLRKKK
ncbi:Acetate--CoA ligase [ADP-forming] II subunit alpha [uncultured archaeon]|nr:Acetate--CoA ligase [ADP-forming] II subunit alpha [uncultured archaeon]